LLDLSWYRIELDPTAAISAAMVKLGIYNILVTVVQAIFYKRGPRYGLLTDIIKMAHICAEVSK
jgi:hypothetical protein